MFTEVLLTDGKQQEYSDNNNGTNTTEPLNLARMRTVSMLENVHIKKCPCTRQNANLYTGLTIQRLLAANLQGGQLYTHRKPQNVSAVCPNTLSSELYIKNFQTTFQCLRI